MRDDAGRAQLWTISPSGDELRQLTRDAFPVASAFTWNHTGTHVAYVADNSVMIVDATTGASRRLTPTCDDETAPRPEACVFSPDGSQIAFVRRLTSAAGCFNQVCVVEVA
jgi:Tol biopolymer transport system component